MHEFAKVLSNLAVWIVAVLQRTTTTGEMSDGSAQQHAGVSDSAGCAHAPRADRDVGKDEVLAEQARLRVGAWRKPREPARARASRPARPPAFAR